MSRLNAIADKQDDITRQLDEGYLDDGSKVTGADKARLLREDRELTRERGIIQREMRELQESPKDKTPDDLRGYSSDIDSGTDSDMVGVVDIGRPPKSQPSTIQTIYTLKELQAKKVAELKGILNLPKSNKTKHADLISRILREQNATQDALEAQDTTVDGILEWSDGDITSDIDTLGIDDVDFSAGSIVGERKVSPEIIRNRHSVSIAIANEISQNGPPSTVQSLLDVILNNKEFSSKYPFGDPLRVLFVLMNKLGLGQVQFRVYSVEDVVAKFGEKFRLAEGGYGKISVNGKMEPVVFLVKQRYSMGLVKVLAHELVHAMTKEKLTSKHFAAVQLNALFNQVKQHLGKDASKHYGMTNLAEFISEAFTEIEFQRLLASIPARTISRGVNTMWDQFIALVHRVIGLPYDPKSVLTALMNETLHIQTTYPELSALAQTTVNYLASARTGVASPAIRDINRLPGTQGIISTKVSEIFQDMLPAAIRTYEDVKAFSQNFLDTFEGAVKSIKEVRGTSLTVQQYLQMPDGTVFNPANIRHALLANPLTVEIHRAMPVFEAYKQARKQALALLNTPLAPVFLVESLYVSGVNRDLIKPIVDSLNSYETTVRHMSPRAKAEFGVNWTLPPDAVKEMQRLIASSSMRDFSWLISSVNEKAVNIRDGVLFSFDGSFPVEEGKTLPSYMEDLFAFEESIRKMEGYNSAKNLSLSLEREANQINEDRINMTYKIHETLMGTNVVDAAEKILILALSQKYVVDYNPHTKTSQLQSITEHNRAIPLLLDEGTIEAIGEKLRVPGLSAKKAFELGVVEGLQRAEKQNKSLRRSGWTKFPRSTSHEDAVELNQATAGSSWCTHRFGVGTAHHQRSGGDFYVYYKNGVPDIAIRTEGSHVAEVRGNNPTQVLTESHWEALTPFFEEHHDLAKTSVDYQNRLKLEPLLQRLENKTLTLEDLYPFLSPVLSGIPNKDEHYQLVRDRNHYGVTENSDGTFSVTELKYNHASKREGGGSGITVSTRKVKTDEEVLDLIKLEISPDFFSDFGLEGTSLQRAAFSRALAEQGLELTYLGLVKQGIIPLMLHNRGEQSISAELESRLVEHVFRNYTITQYHAERSLKVSDNYLDQEIPLSAVKNLREVTNASLHVSIHRDTDILPNLQDVSSIEIVNNYIPGSPSVVTLPELRVAGWISLHDVSLTVNDVFKYQNHTFSGSNNIRLSGNAHLTYKKDGPQPHAWESGFSERTGYLARGPYEEDLSNLYIGEVSSDGIGARGVEGRVPTFNLEGVTTISDVTVYLGGKTDFHLGLQDGVTVGTLNITGEPAVDGSKTDMNINVPSGVLVDKLYLSTGFEGTTTISGLTTVSSLDILNDLMDAKGSIVFQDLTLLGEAVPSERHSAHRKVRIAGAHLIEFPALQQINSLDLEVKNSGINAPVLTSMNGDRSSIYVSYNKNESYALNMPLLGDVQTFSLRNSNRQPLAVSLPNLKPKEISAKAYSLLILHLPNAEMTRATYTGVVHAGDRLAPIFTYAPKAQVRDIARLQGEILGFVVRDSKGDTIYHNNQYDINDNTDVIGLVEYIKNKDNRLLQDMQDMVDRIRALDLDHYSSESTTPVQDIDAKLSLKGLSLGSVNEGLKKNFRAIVNHIASKLINAAVEVVYVDNEVQLPVNLKEQLVATAVLSRGLFVQWNDGRKPTIYLIGDNLARDAERSGENPDTLLRKVFSHELVAHFGLYDAFKVIFGNENAYHNFLDKEGKRNPKLLQTAVDALLSKGVYLRFAKKGTKPAGVKGFSTKIKMGDTLVDAWIPEENYAELLDEYIASRSERMIDGRMAYDLKNVSFLRRVYNSIRHAFRKLGLTKLNDNDIYELLILSHHRLFKPEANVDSKFREIVRGSDLISALKQDPTRDSTPMTESESIMAAQSPPPPVPPRHRQVYNLTQAAMIQNLDNLYQTLNDGKLGKGFSEKLWANKVDSIIDSVTDNKVFRYLSPLKGLGFKGYYLRLDNKVRGQIARTEKFSNTLLKGMKGFNKDQSEAVLNYFTDANATVAPMELAGIKPDVVSNIEDAKTQIMEMGQAFVDLGLLDQGVFDQNKGAYLPTMYFKHLNEGVRSGKKISTLDFLRKKNVNMSPISRATLGELKNPALIVPDFISVAGRDLALLQANKMILEASKRHKTGWVIGGSKSINTGLRDHTGKPIKMNEYQLEAEIERIKKQLVEGVHGKEFNIDAATYQAVQARLPALERAYQRVLAFRMREMVDILVNQGVDRSLITPEYVSDYIKDNYRRMPYSPAFKHLAGKWVHKGIYEDYVDISEVIAGQSGLDGRSTPESTFKHFLGKLSSAHQFWKFTKVVANVPVSTLRNMIGGLTQLDTFTTTPWAVLVKDLVGESLSLLQGKESVWLQRAIDFGIPGATWSSAELNRIKHLFIDDYKNKFEIQTLESNWKKTAKVGWMESLLVLKTLGLYLQEIYAAQELLLKTVALKDHVRRWESQNGRKLDNLPPLEKEAVLNEAAIQANTALYDYGRVTNFVRSIRSTPFLGSPFFTFAYKSGPQSLINAARVPWKTAKYMALGGLLAAYAMSQLDWDEEEVERFRNNLPTEIQNRGTMFLLPWRDAQGRPQVMRVDYMFPWAPWWDAARSIGSAAGSGSASKIGGGVLDALTGDLGFLGGPTHEIIHTLTTGEEKFTGRPVIKPTSTSESEKLVDVMRYLTNMWIPPVLGSHGFLGHLLDKSGVGPTILNTGTPLDKHGREKETTGQLITRGLGFTTYGKNPADVMGASRKDFEFKLKGIETRRSTIIKDRNISVIDKQSKMRDLNEERKLLYQSFKDRIK